MKMTFKFSIGTLILLTAVVGLALGLGASWSRSAKMEALKDEFATQLGLFEIEDPNHVYVRELRSGFKNGWRLRAYVPEHPKIYVVAGICDSGTDKVATYQPLAKHRLGPGCYVVDIELSKRVNGLMFSRTYVSNVNIGGLFDSSNSISESSVDALICKDEIPDDLIIEDDQVSSLIRFLPVRSTLRNDVNQFAGSIQKLDPNQDRMMPVIRLPAPIRRPDEPQQHFAIWVATEELVNEQESYWSKIKNDGSTE